MVIVYNSGRYRMAGRGSLAGLMPYGDANEIVLDMVSLSTTQFTQSPSQGPTQLSASSLWSAYCGQRTMSHIQYKFSLLTQSRRVKSSTSSPILPCWLAFAPPTPIVTSPPSCANSRLSVSAASRTFPPSASSTAPSAPTSKPRGCRMMPKSK